MGADRSATTRVGPRDVLGVPAVPPGRVAAVAAAVRARIGRAHGAMVPPPVAILESVFGLLDHGGLVALCELGVPDALDRRMTIEALARRLDVATEPLTRLLRYGAARGWVRIDRRGQVVPTAVTRFLRADHPGGWRAWVDFAAGDEVVGAVGAVADAVRRGADAFTLANGAPFFPWMAAHPERGRAFDAAMAAGGRLHGLVLSAALDWSGSRRVCDVGGGDGSLLRTLLARQPHLTGVLLDLPEVTARAAPATPAEPLEIVAGDAFDEVPGGCDTYLFVNVLHDWDDEDAVRLLARAAQDAPVDARVVVVEGERALRPVAGIAASTDLLMLALAPGGRERTSDEFAALGRRAGLRLRQSVRLASADMAHVFIRGGGSG